MAFKPSLRRKAMPMQGELEIRPVMNLMVCLIPILLQGAELVNLWLKRFTAHIRRRFRQLILPSRKLVKTGFKTGHQIRIQPACFGQCQARPVQDRRSRCWSTQIDYVTEVSRVEEIDCSPGYKDKDGSLSPQVPISLPDTIDVLMSRPSIR
jgi:hypothetical protein